MPDATPSQRGRSRVEISDDIIEILQATDRRATTLGQLTERVDASSATMNNRLKDLVEESTIESEKMGGATGYWIPAEDGPRIPQLNFRLIGANLFAGGFLGIVLLANLYPSVTGFAATDIIDGVMWLLMGAGLAFVTFSYVYDDIQPTENALHEDGRLDAEGAPQPSESV